MTASTSVWGNGIALVVLRAGNLATRLVLLFVLARDLPTPTFGAIVLALSVAEVGKVVADFGMDTIAIREYASSRAPHPGRFASTLALGKWIGGGVTFAVLALGWAWNGMASDPWLGIALALTVPTSLLTNHALDWFQARLCIAPLVVPVVIVNVIAIAFAWCVVPHLQGPHPAALCFPAFELAIGLVLAILFARERGGDRFEWPRARELRALVRQAWPVGITAIFIMVYSRLDVIVLARLLPPETVAHYGMAFRITEPFQIVAAAFGLSVLSRFAAAFAEPRPVAATALRHIAVLLAYGVGVGGALMWLAPPLVLRLLPDYEPALPVLRVLAATLAVRSLNAALAGILQGAGRFRLLTGFAFWNLAVIGALLHILVGTHGVVGAALALLLGEILNSLAQGVAVFMTVRAHDRKGPHVVAG